MLPEAVDFAVGVLALDRVGEAKPGWRSVYFPCHGRPKARDRDGGAVVPSARDPDALVFLDFLLSGIPERPLPLPSWPPAPRIAVAWDVCCPSDSKLVGAGSRAAYRQSPARGWPESTLSERFAATEGPRPGCCVAIGPPCSWGT